ncbi:YbhB/YbcL family Raf kinase inhibitor-like protein [Sphingobium xenophagum]|uniref:YbhB/YbcL family Raf kinase inhibitor-like protein n=1 Tax=Sphingobium xenophagum TaxID=121428 RepID=UPI00036DDF2C|nr:YbhB/YbcL family Raf kinase inhibitor-like protein [Sphingobium xenophagum]
MAGTYHGYDGPCPPWNDELVHRYVFTVYALAAPALADGAVLDGSAVREALERAPILAQASLTGLYTLNPALTA